MGRSQRAGLGWRWRGLAIGLGMLVMVGLGLAADEPTTDAGLREVSRGLRDPGGEGRRRAGEGLSSRGPSSSVAG